jgi:hypothetical protein
MNLIIETLMVTGIGLVVVFILAMVDPLHLRERRESKEHKK